MSVPLSPSELHSLFAGLDLTPRASRGSSSREPELNRQWSGGEFGPAAAQPLWAIEGIEAWQAEFQVRLLEYFSQTRQPAWEAQPRSTAAIRLHHFVEANRTRQGFRCDSLVPGTPVWIVLDPHLVATHLDLALGATESQVSAAGMLARGPIQLGPLEVRIMHRCVSTICHALNHSADSRDLREYPLLSLSADESWIAGIPFHLATMLATLDLRFSLGDYSGNLTIALTREGLQSLVPNRGLSSGAFGGHPITSSSDADAETTGILEPDSVLRVVLARATLSPEELAGLQVGDVVLTSQEAHSLCEVWVDGVPRFEAAAVTFQDHKAIRLTSETTIHTATNRD